MYYHPVARSFEFLVHTLFKRLRDLGNLEDPCMIEQFRPIAENVEIPLDVYFELDENACAYGFAKLCHDEDPILKDLAERVRDRNLFKYEERTDSAWRRKRNQLKKAGLDPAYYLGKDEVTQNPYKPYSGENAGSIWVLMNDGTMRELSNASNIVYSLIHGPKRDDEKMFYPLLAEK